jgi:hypothetical protein
MATGETLSYQQLTSPKEGLVKHKVKRRENKRVIDGFIEQRDYELCLVSIGKKGQNLYDRAVFPI